MKFGTWILSGAAMVGLVACGDVSGVGTSAFQSNLATFEADTQIADLIAGTDTGTTASFETLTTQGAATYAGPVAIHLDETTLLGETITGGASLNTPDLVGTASIRTAFTDEASTLEGDFSSFAGQDGVEYGGTLALTNGRISSSSDGSGGTIGTAIVGGTLTGDGAAAGTYSAGVEATISEDGQSAIIRGTNVTGEPGRDFTFTAVGAVAATE